MTHHDMTRLTTAILVLAIGGTLSADRVRLRSGKIVEGTFIGADSRAVRMLRDDGQVSEAAIEDVAALEFSARKPAPAATPPPKAAPAPVTKAAAPAVPAPKPKRTITVPANTTLNVRLTQDIDADASTAGQLFKA